MKVFVDTTVLVASVVALHPHHARTIPVIRRVLSGEDDGHVAAHGLAEAYAVLTTLPVTPRIGPDAAARLIQRNVVDHFQVVALTAREYARLVSTLGERAVMGGATYDVIQLACARKAGAERIYTFNLHHFQRLDPGLADRVAVP